MAFTDNPERSNVVKYQIQCARQAVNKKYLSYHDENQCEIGAWNVGCWCESISVTNLLSETSSFKLQLHGIQRRLYCRQSLHTDRRQKSPNVPRLYNGFSCRLFSLLNDYHWSGACSPHHLSRPYWRQHVSLCGRINVDLRCVWWYPCADTMAKSQGGIDLCWQIWKNWSLWNWRGYRLTVFFHHRFVHVDDGHIPHLRQVRENYPTGPNGNCNCGLLFIFLKVFTCSYSTHLRPHRTVWKPSLMKMSRPLLIKTLE